MKKSVDEANWAKFEAAIRAMFPADEASALLAHARERYMDPSTKRWREALRENERGQHLGYVRGLIRGLPR
jgi:hypothetical protein